MLPSSIDAGTPPASQDGSPDDLLDSKQEEVRSALPKSASPSDVLCAFSSPYTESPYVWQEVTQPFLDATKELALGELLHDDMFGLFEAMSAIEMMDPKMDAGMRCNRQNKRPFTFQSAVKANHLRLDHISRSEQIGVIDSTMACLVTWLEGHSLAQTVFTNLYLHQPFEIGDPLMKAFSIGVLKLVDIIKDFVARGSVFEEEDFQPASYCFKLAPEVSEQRAGGMLREVEEDLQKTLRSTKAKEGQVISQEHEEAGALFSRLRFLRLLYLGLVALYRQELSDGSRYVVAAKEQVKNIVATISLGAKSADCKDNFMGFDRLANQRLLPPTFPRYTEIRTREEGIFYFKGLVDRLIQAITVTQMITFQAALEFFIDYSVTSPCVLSRSVVQALYQPLQNMSSVSLSGKPLLQAGSLSSFQELLKETCKAFIAPPALLLKTPPFQAKQVKECIDNFFNQCCRPMGLLLQTFGHNRARQRDKIASLLEEFAAIQEEADKLDTMLNAVSSQSSEGGRPHMLFFSTWLLYHILRVMVRYVLSGFELELYSFHEYPYLYWYLYELLYPWLTTCLHRADAYLLEYEQIVEAHRLAGKNKKKVKSISKKKVIRPYAKEIATYQGFASMCAGFFKLLGALKMEKKILIPSPEFDNECVRYEHRFAPFAHLLTPPLMPYGQYLEIYDHTIKGNSSRDLFIAAARDFQRSRQIFETVSLPQSGVDSEVRSAELNQVIAVNKNNFVAASVLAKDCSRRVDFDFSSHATFPIVRFV